MVPPAQIRSVRFLDVLVRHSHASNDRGNADAKEGLITKFIQRQNICVLAQHFFDFCLGEVHHLARCRAFVLHRVKHAGRVNINATDTVFLQIVPVLVDPPGRTGALRNLMSIPTNEIDAALDFTLKFGQLLRKGDNCTVSGRVTSHARLPRIDMAIDKQIFFRLLTAAQKPDRERKHIPAARRLRTDIDLDVFVFLAQRSKIDSSTVGQADAYNLGNILPCFRCWIAPDRLQTASADIVLLRLSVLAPVRAHHRCGAMLIGDPCLLWRSRAIGDLHQDRLAAYILPLIIAVVAGAEIQKLQLNSLQWRRGDMAARPAL